MRYSKFVYFLTAIMAVGTLISCERDDICPSSTSTTPRLLLKAYDATIQENRKNIFGLLVIGVDNDVVLEGYEIATIEDINLPLRTDTTTTQYRLIKDTTINNNGTPDDSSDDYLEGNEDIITINYTTEQIYVSRACGYKTIFKNVSLTIEDDGDNWILSRQATTDNQSVEDEAAAHYNIYH
ncbi:DUF6452 family protein [Mariniflexile ostreae]|uniref:DUF6452 family protein n=1 Tax=Mariniflexile ostreae TaxID=1520892 RepID=A0ABV5FDW5_9FLAO